MPRRRIGLITDFVRADHAWLEMQAAPFAIGCAPRSPGGCKPRVPIGGYGLTALFVLCSADAPYE